MTAVRTSRGFLIATLLAVGTILVDAMLAAVRTFGGGRPLDDDETLLVARLPSQIRPAA